MIFMWGGLQDAKIKHLAVEHEVMFIIEFPPTNSLLFFLWIMNDLPAARWDQLQINGSLF